MTYVLIATVVAFVLITALCGLNLWVHGLPMGRRAKRRELGWYILSIGMFTLTVAVASTWLYLAA